MNLSELIEKLEEGQIAKASFGGNSWFITKFSGFIRYVYVLEIGETVPLTYSNLNALYEIQGYSNRL